VNEVVVGTPKVVALAVEVLPKHLLRAGLGSLHSCRVSGSDDGAKHLRRERGRALAIVQPDRDRETVFGPKRREEASLKERSLAEAGDTVEQHEDVASHKPNQFVDLFAAPGEELAIAFGKGGQPDPRVLRIRKMGCGGSHWEAALRRRSRTMAVRVLMKSSRVDHRQRERNGTLESL
jgi:hypothetical protein